MSIPKFKKDYFSYVYIWFDPVRKLFYIGGHYGAVEDSYVASSKIFMNVYKVRNSQLKMRILEYISSDCKKLLREREQYWLNFIKPNELYNGVNKKNKTIRYYNQKIHAAGGNGSANKGKSHPAWNKGYSKEERELRKAGLLSFIPLDRPRIKIRLIKPKEKRVPWNKGKNISDEQIAKMKKTIKNNGPREAWNKGISPKPEQIVKMIQTRRKNGYNPGKNLSKLYGDKNPMKNPEILEKFKKRITGRRKTMREDGTWYWSYPDKNRGPNGPLF